ncbi:uncharacterized protein TNCV_4755361 [Trichonephila clavipes]|nr:uncharacterized protein TNCV_4755361 [Trichonephila clavipes]
MFLVNSRRHWCMVMFHVISHGTNPVKNGSHGNKENHILPLQAYSKLRHWGRDSLHGTSQSNVSASIYVCYCSRTSVFLNFLRTVNGRVFNTYQDACRELQLLEDDNHWDLTLADAALTSTPNNIRQLFAIILTTCYPSQAQTLWEKYKNCMTEDILHELDKQINPKNIDYTPEMYNEALVLIEDLCVLISNLPLNQYYGMPSPNRPATDLVNTDLQRENQYDHGSLATIIMKQ